MRLESAIKLIDFIFREIIDIALIGETHLNQNTKFSIRNFVIYRNDRDGHKAVQMVIRKNISHIQLTQHTQS